MSGEGLHNPADTLQLESDIEDVQDAVDDLTADVVLLQADVDAIAVLAEAEAILEETGGTITTDGTEQNVYINNAPGGIYEPRWFNINFANHTVTEALVIKTYHRNVDGGGWIQDDRDPFIGVPINTLIWVALRPSRFGCRVTVEKTAGTNRAYVWEVFYEVAP